MSTSSSRPDRTWTLPWVEAGHVSPLAPKGELPDLPVVAGIRFAAAHTGVKYKDRNDVALMVLDPGSEVAGVFTTSKTRSDAVNDCAAKLGGDFSAGAAFLVNSGNANAFTGQAGERSVAEITKAAGEVLGLPAAAIFTSSTGVIGEPLPHDRIVAKLGELKASASSDELLPAAQAICTTDTFVKVSGATLDTPDGKINIVGFAKGSGMIAPDMATMLVYIFTDAKVSGEDLQKMTSELSGQTFNRITVDSDTSTSDTLLVGATGASGVEATGDGEFAAKMHDVMLELAHQVVRDGEGARKFVEVRVTGARSEADAELVAKAVANSPLVKTALAGEDANWGRVVMAVGKSGAEADRDRLSIRFGDILVAEKGWRVSDYSEEDASAYMKKDEILIDVDLGIGDGRATIWTCDLTHRYIEINADYRS